MDLRDPRLVATRWPPGLHDAGIKIPAGIDTELMFTEGRLLLERVRDRTRKRGRRPTAGRRGGDRRGHATPSAPGRGPARGAPVRRGRRGAVAATRCVTWSRRGPVPGVRRPAAARSSAAGTSSSPAPRAPPQDPKTGTVTSGTFRTAAERLDAVAAMGFDVVYLPPIHPIGEVNRKGPNNTLTPGPDDPGSPWAIGPADGGHDAIHPDLGTIEDFDAFVARADELGLEVALDLALQCAPDHPWVTEHPEWFTTAPTARSPTPRTRRRSTRTSTRSTSTTTPRASTARCCGSSATGSTTACGSSGSTTRTPSRWRSGSG